MTPRSTGGRAAVAVLACGLVAAGCGGDDGGDGDGPPRPTLPPIATTSTIPSSTTLNLIDQDRFVTIEEGDILSEIAQEYQISQDDLMELNGITDPDAVYVGQVLELPVDAVLPPGEPAPTSLVSTTTSP